MSTEKVKSEVSLNFAEDASAVVPTPPEQDDEAMYAPAEGAAARYPRYHAIFINFMSHFHEKSTPYPQDHVFTNEDLFAVTPNSICAYLNSKVFGKSKPEHGDKLVSNLSSAEFIRKAIEHYMPHDANPAKSSEVQNLIQKIRSLDDNGARGLPQDSHTTSTEADNSETVQMLQKLHNRNAHYLNIVQAMDSTIRTLTKTVHEMKRTLESHNLQIQNQMILNEEQNDIPTLPIMNQTATTSLINKLKDEQAEIDAAMKSLAKSDNDSEPPISMGITRMKYDSQGYCTFYNGEGKELDMPEGFELPTCDLIDAWTAWLTGFPNHKFRVTATTEDGTADASYVDAPIKPLRSMKLRCIPSSLKKKYKDGWRPILQYMELDVQHMIAGVSPADMDEAFIGSVFDAAMETLVFKNPNMFAGNNERSKTWKVATWSRKIREQKGKRSMDDSAEVAVDVGIAVAEIATAEQI